MNVSTNFLISLRFVVLAGKGFYQVYLAEKDDIPNGLVAEGSEFASLAEVFFEATASTSSFGSLPSKNFSSSLKNSIRDFFFEVELPLKYAIPAQRRTTKQKTKHRKAHPNGARLNSTKKFTFAINSCRRSSNDTGQRNICYR